MQPHVTTIAYWVAGLGVLVAVQGFCIAWLTARVWRLQANADAVERRLRFRIAEPDRIGRGGHVIDRSAVRTYRWF